MAGLTDLWGMEFRKITEADVAFFRLVPGMVNVFVDEENLAIAASDQTEDLHYLPEVVLQPGTVEAVSAIMKYCNEHLLPVTPRGAGTGLSGGALPVHAGVVLDMKRFNKIINVDKRNLQVVVEPGVITQELQEHVKAEGLMYPPDPASKGSCFIGVNVSENSGGPRAEK